MSTLGIDLGGTKILAAVVSEGRVLDRVRVDTPQTGFADVVAAMAGAARELISRGHEVTAVGVGSPGPLDHERGRVVWAPNIAGMVDAPVVDALREELGLPVPWRTTPTPPATPSTSTARRRACGRAST